MDGWAWMAGTWEGEERIAATRWGPAGTAQGRIDAEESTCFLNNIGIGLQFVAVGAAVFQQAKANGVGREIPTDWFLESVHP